MVFIPGPRFTRAGGTKRKGASGRFKTRRKFEIKNIVLDAVVKTLCSVTSVSVICIYMT